MGLLTGSLLVASAVLFPLSDVDNTFGIGFSVLSFSSFLLREPSPISLE